MVDIERESLLTVKEAAALLRVSIKAVRRLYTTGKRGVRLEVLTVCGVRTSREALQRFIAATGAQVNDLPPPQRTEGEARRAGRRAMDRAMQKLRGKT